MWVEVRSLQIPRPMSLSLDAREARPPLLALVAPALYLLACAGCVRAHVLDPTADVGVAGLLVAVGLAPSFAIPAVFSTRQAKLATDGDALFVDGRAVRFDAIKVEPAPKGSARVLLTMRSGNVRTFYVDDIRVANLFAAKLPPVSAPAGALAA